MIPLLVGWGYVRGADSHRLVHPDGPDVAVLYYRERVRPLDRLSLLVERWSRHPRFTDAQVGKPEVVTTGEGEYTATVSVKGLVNGQPAEQTLGFVFVDDYYALVHSICLVEAELDRVGLRVRQLVANDTHVMQLRRRWFVYARPPAWQGLARGWQTDWHPPDYPRNRTSITAFPATPSEIHPADLVEQRVRLDMAAGFRPDVVEEPTEVTSSHGLSGLVYDVPGLSASNLRFFRRFVVFRDAKFVYPLLFESAAPAELLAPMLSLFDDLCRSVQPIPQVAGAPTGIVFTHWME